MAEGRIYKVTSTLVEGGNPITQVRLVEAGTQSQASRHVAKDTIKVELVTVRDAMTLAKMGVVIEDATGEDVGDADA